MGDEERHIETMTDTPMRDPITRDPITDRVVAKLAAAEHILVPIAELYDQLAAEGLMSWVTPELFEDLLDSDDRFEVYEGLGESDLLNPVARAELQMRGLLGGRLVMLRDLNVSSEAVMHDVLLHLQEMNAALETAWHLHGAEDPAVEAELLGLLMMGDMLEREVKEALRSYAGPKPDADEAGEPG